ncbi:MAG TPA: hypothetical protein VFI47_24260 [Acidimicrobiales bacterium]|nr:hypothetical protein [Acidimicrobiales bacterium]
MGAPERADTTDTSATTDVTGTAADTTGVARAAEFCVADICVADICAALVDGCDGAARPGAVRAQARRPPGRSLDPGWALGRLSRGASGATAGELRAAIEILRGAVGPAGPPAHRVGDP